MQERLLKAKEVIEMIGLSRTTIWRLEKSGQFPKRRQITKSKVGWLKSEVMDWLLSRPNALI